MEDSKLSLKARGLDDCDVAKRYAERGLGLMGMAKILELTVIVVTAQGAKNENDTICR